MSAPVGTSSAAAACGDQDVIAAVGQFIESWNHHDLSSLRHVLTDDALLDMSTKTQRASPPAQRGGYETASGWDEIQRFVTTQWDLGETLHFDRLQPFDGGAYAHGMVAKFADGSTQVLNEAKFAFECRRRAFEHVEIVSATAATS